MMAAILNSAILNLAILDLAILVFPLKLTPTCQDWFPPFAQKKPSLIHSDSTWWWQPSWILPCWIQTLPSWIHTPTYLLSDSLKNTLTPFWLWLKLIQSDSNSFILTQLDDGSHLEFCHHEFGHLVFSHLRFSSQTHSHLSGLVPTICTKKTSLPLPSPPFAQKKLHSFILTQLNDGSHLEFYHVGLRKLPSFILTQLDDGSHLELCHVGFRHLVFFSQIHSKTLSLHSDSDSN